MIAISETKLPKSKIIKNIVQKGYSFICKNNESSAGGVALYVKKKED